MNKINLIGTNDIKNFVKICENIKGKVELIHAKEGYRINAKSYLGVLLASSEWGDEVWVDSEEDIYSDIESFIEIGVGDGAFVHD